MIDVVFLLLIFFVWSSRFDPPESNWVATASLTKPETATPPEVTGMGSRLPDLTVRIASGPDGLSYRWQAVEILDLDQLARVASQVADQSSLPTVILDPDDGVAMQAVVDVRDVLTATGLRDIAFAAEMQ